MTYKNYFEDINAEKQIKKLTKKYKNKKIILYGMGEYFDEIMENYDLSDLNIVGICDLKFAKDKNCNTTQYTAIAPKELNNIDFDVILVTAYQELFIIKYLKKEILKKHKKIKAFLEPSFIDLIKIHFSKKEKYIEY